MGKLIYLTGKKGMVDKALEAQAEPDAGDISLTCDTKECIAYVHNVEGKSKALTSAYELEVKAIQDGTSKIDDKQKRIDFLKDFLTWYDAKRKPWLERYPDLVSDCGSVLPGPCNDARYAAGQHEGDVQAFEKRFKAYTGKDLGIKDAPPVDPDKNKGKGSLFPSFKLGSVTPIAVLALAAFLLYTLSKK